VTGPAVDQLALRLEIEDLYADYAEIVDGGLLERWAALFTDPCLYRIVSKENFDQDLPLSLMRCESRGMLEDRAFASAELNVYAPRTWRHLIGHVRAAPDGAEIAARASFAVLETASDGSTHLLCAGAYRDRLARIDGTLRFRERLCIYDTALIPGSIVFPL